MKILINRRKKSINLKKKAFNLAKFIFLFYFFFLSVSHPKEKRGGESTVNLHGNIMFYIFVFEFRRKSRIVTNFNRNIGIV